MSVYRIPLTILLCLFVFFGSLAFMDLMLRPRHAVVVIQSSGIPASFRLDVSWTDQDQADGLMYRGPLPSDGGMLFPFQRPRMASVWMKNTLIPLDILFVDGRGYVLGVVHSARPGSLDRHASPAPSSSMIELPGGTALRLGISTGSIVKSVDFY